MEHPTLLSVKESTFYSEVFDCVYTHAYILSAMSDFNATEIVTEIPAGATRWEQGIQIYDDDINEGREEFEVFLTVEDNFPVTYLIRTAVCRIPESDRKLSSNDVLAGFDLVLCRFLLYTQRRPLQ